MLEANPPRPLMDAAADGRLLVQLYSKVAETLSAPQTVERPSDVLLSLMVPGILIRPRLDPDDPQTLYDVSNLLNATLRCSWVVAHGAGTVSDIYKAILDGKETPLVTLSPEQRKALDAARHYLFQADGEPSADYADYLRHQLAYLAALDAYEEAVATERNGGTPVPKKLKRALREAESAWRVEGHQEDVDRALATVVQYAALDPAAYWYRLAERYRRYTLTLRDASEFQLVTANPPFREWFSEFGWTELSFDSTDFEHQPRSGTAGLEPQRCCCCHTTAEPPPGDPVPPPFSLSARIRRVSIVRPWLDTLVLKTRAWRWSRASVGFGTMISTGGDLVGAVVPQGVMPVLPTTAILARDVVIVTPGAGVDRWALRAGEDARVGPFRLAGASVEGGRISMPDPQLVGYLSEILPRCPDPDPTLVWPELDVDAAALPRVAGST